jgi:hypothetical protein
VSDALLRLLSQEDDEANHRGDERHEGGERGEHAGRETWKPVARERDQDDRDGRRGKADPGGNVHVSPSGS